MGKVKRLGNKKIALSYIRKGDITIIKKEDTNFNGLIERTVGLNLNGVSFVEQIMQDVSDEQYVEYVIDRYKDIN